MAEAMNPEAQLAELSARLKVMGVIMRLGHDLFGAPDFEQAGSIAVNSARPVLNFKSSTMIGVENNRASILSQFAQVKLNPHAEWAKKQCALCETLNFREDGTLQLDKSALESDKLSDEAKDVLKSMLENTPVMLALKLTCPRFLTGVKMTMVWLIEFDDAIPGFAVTAAKLLAANYSEALFCQKFSHTAVTNTLKKWRPLYVFSVILVVALLAMWGIRIPEGASADFVLRAPDISTVYSRFEGAISRCYFSNNARVQKGDLVAEYDVKTLEFHLNTAIGKLRETEAELDTQERNLNDRESQGRVRLLKARLESANVAVAEAEWYLANAKLYAPQDGVLVLVDGQKELLENRAVRTGDKLFEVFGGAGMIADVRVNERDSSILLARPEKITLFLHTAPETPIVGDILKIDEYPILTEQKTYCYNIRARLPDNKLDELRYGMRGIAKVSGNKVSLLYYLFKSVILYVRGL